MFCLTLAILLPEKELNLIVRVGGYNSPCRSVFLVALELPKGLTTPGLPTSRSVEPPGCVR